MNYELSDNLYFATHTQLDDARRLVGLVLLATRPAHIVHLLDDAWVDVAVVLGRRLATDIDGGADEGLLKPVAQLVTEGFLRNAYADTAVFADEVRRKVDGTIKDKGCRLHDAVDKLPGHIRHLAHIALQAGIAVDKTDKCLAFVALLNLVHTGYGLLVGGIAAYTPYCVRWVENHPTLPKHFHSLPDILFLSHNRVQRYTFFA